MKLLRDVVCQIKGRGQGCSLISATVKYSLTVVPLAKGKQPIQSTIHQEPWGPQQHFLKMGFNQAAGLHNQGIANNPYPGQTYASFSPQTENALNMTEQRALAGSPLQTRANEQLMQTLNGDYLYGGPGFDAAFQAASNKITPMVQSGFNRAGRLNSGLARQAETQALADAFASQYGQERQNQLGAMQLAPQMAQAEYNDLAKLAGVGQAREGQSQSAIDEAIMRHTYGNDEGWNQLAKFMSSIQGNYGADQTTLGPKGNKGAGILGGALTGGVAGSAAGPWGAGIGAGLGALAGLF